jgi:capsular polysaccharide transport system permease protein
MTVLASIGGLWLSGLGLGLMLSVIADLVPELARLVRIAFIPLYFISGVMAPGMAFAQPYRGWIFLNPFIHGLESLRGGFFPRFHAAPEASLPYLYGFALLTIFFGLALHVRFADRLVAQ